MSTARSILADRLTVGHAGHPVVRAIDLDAEPGSTVALVGTNGSGKSTLLKTLAGLLPPIEGRLEVLGAAPGTQPRRVAYLPQHHVADGLLSLRARDVVRTGRFAALGLTGRPTADDRRLVSEAMERCAITPLAGRPMRALSGGQRQRVRLAQVIARDAEVLLLDEPTTGLDATSRERYLDIVAAERERGATVVIATHDLGEALRCDLVVLLAGRVVAFGPPADVLQPDLLLDAFGVALQAVPHRDHTDVLAPEAAHGHGHDHDLDHDHDHEVHRHGSARRPRRYR